ncbi:hypothetical protein [Tenacibaculum halocynthiae]|uniref:hypothetical protein n=1 Tax=Tenacibaculum halocynthiae TaxID=1254437 RepID=UPI003893EACB
MSTINWNKIANEAASQTDSEFNTQITSLTNLNITEVDTFIQESNISNANALKVLKIIGNATDNNNSKATAISTIENGVNFLVKLASKIV